MIVVSDTSPLNYLILLGCVDVLPVLFHDVITVPAVIQELLHVRADPMVRAWASHPPAWLTVRAPSLAGPSFDLGPGESQAIALAMELVKERSAVSVLIDERNGVAVASTQGLTVFRTIFVLEEASVQGLLDLPKTIERLRKTTFFISETVVQNVLDRHAQRQSQRPR